MTPDEALHFLIDKGYLNARPTVAEWFAEGFNSTSNHPPDDCFCWLNDGRTVPVTKLVWWLMGRDERIALSRN